MRVFQVSSYKKTKNISGKGRLVMSGALVTLTLGLAGCNETMVYQPLTITDKIALNSELAANCSGVEGEAFQACFFKVAKKKKLSEADTNAAWQLYNSLQHSRSVVCGKGQASDNGSVSCVGN